MARQISRYLFVVSGHSSAIRPDSLCVSGSALSMLRAIQSRYPDTASSHLSVILVPLVTMDVVIPFSLASQIRRSSSGYSMGSPPAKLIFLNPACESNLTISQASPRDRCAHIQVCSKAVSAPHIASLQKVKVNSWNLLFCFFHFEFLFHTTYSMPVFFLKG